MFVKVDTENVNKSTVTFYLLDRFSKFKFLGTTKLKNKKNECVVAS